MTQHNPQLASELPCVVECPKESLSRTMAFSSRDWSINREDAWMYGIVCGWDSESLAELKQRHGWTDDQVARLDRLHGAWEMLS